MVSAVRPDVVSLAAGQMTPLVSVALLAMVLLVQGGVKVINDRTLTRTYRGCRLNSRLLRPRRGQNLKYRNFTVFKTFVVFDHVSF